MEQKAAAMAVAKKLSALRATLDDEEQMVLDGMIEGAYSVSAHGMVYRELPREAPAAYGENEAEAHMMTNLKATPREVPGEFPGEDEASAHAMAANPKATPREFPGEFPGEDEAGAHAMAANPKATPREFPGEFPGEDEAGAHAMAANPKATPREFPGEFPGEDEVIAHALEVFKLTYDETKEAYIVVT